MKKGDKERAAEHIVSLAKGILEEHAEKIVEAHQKMDLSLSVNIRVTLKHDEGKLNLAASLNYAKEKVSDHANDVLDFDQAELPMGEG